jgi:DNA-directed RNA polymerase subunit alpha
MLTSSNIKLINISENLSKFVVSPLPCGFGITLGNALRRTLLSSIPGTSMFAIKLNKIKHEFSTIEGITEDVTQIILNLKKLAIQIDDSISNDEISN